MASRSEVVSFTLVLSVLLLLGMGLWELGLRAFWHNPYVGEAPDHVLVLPIHHPNSDHVVDRSETVPDDPTVRFRTDSRSYILPSSQYEHPDATVVFLGGSTTASLAVREELRFPARVSTLLSEQGLRVNTLNVARWGGTIHDSINVLLNHVVLDEPDIVIAMHGGTDQSLLSGAGNYQRKMGAFVSLPDVARWLLQRFSSDSYVAGFLRRSVSGGNERARRGFAMLGADGPEPEVPIEEFATRVRILVLAARELRIVPVLVTEPLVRRGDNHKLFNQTVRDVGAELGAPVIDLARHIEEDTPGWDEPMKVFYDGVHVTENGSALYAAYISREILPVVREVAAKRAAGAR